MDIKTVKTIDKIDELVDFFANVFSDYTVVNEQSKLTKKELMESQFNEDSDFLMYIEDNNKIVAALFGYSSKPTNAIILHIMGVLKEYRLKKYGSKLLEELVKRAKEKNYDQIILTSKTENYDFYIKNGFKPVLSYVVFDNISNEEFDKLNKYNFEQISYYVHDYMMDGKEKHATRVTYYVDYPKFEYLKYYNDLFEGSSASYSFVKNLK